MSDDMTPTDRKYAAVEALAHLALRTAEIHSLRWDDLAFTTDGVIITVRRSKNDKIGITRVHGFACPADALRSYREAQLRARGSLDGDAKVFPGTVDSLRSGFITHQIRRGASASEVATLNQLRRLALRRYIDWNWRHGGGDSAGGASRP